MTASRFAFARRGEPVCSPGIALLVFAGQTRRSAPTFSSYLSYRPHGRYLVVVLRKVCHGGCSIRCNWMSGSVTRDNYKGVVNPCLNTLGLQIKVTKRRRRWERQCITLFYRLSLAVYCNPAPLDYKQEEHFFSADRYKLIKPWICHFSGKPSTTRLTYVDFGPFGRRPLVREWQKAMNISTVS